MQAAGHQEGAQGGRFRPRRVPVGHEHPVQLEDAGESPYRSARSIVRPSRITSAIWRWSRSARVQSHNRKSMWTTVASSGVTAFSHSHCSKAARPHWLPTVA
jgi:hypothetical protein